MSTTIKLRYSVTFNGEETSELILRRPKVQDRLLAERSGGSDIDKEMRLMANLCEVVPDVILQLDLADYAALQEQLADFLS